MPLNGTCLVPRRARRATAAQRAGVPRTRGCTGRAAKPGTRAPVLLRRRSAIRRKILRMYGLHPIKDRARVGRRLPKLYVAHCRRLGHGGDAFWVKAEPIPLMRVTADTKPTSYVDPSTAW